MLNTKTIDTKVTWFRITGVLLSSRLLLHQFVPTLRSIHSRIPVDSNTTNRVKRIQLSNNNSTLNVWYSSKFKPRGKKFQCELLFWMVLYPVRCACVVEGGMLFCCFVNCLATLLSCYNLHDWLVITFWQRGWDPFRIRCDTWPFLFFTVSGAPKVNFRKISVR